MNLKVIGAGFGRTGTESLKAALEILGLGPCYHMHVLNDHQDHVSIWEAARKGEEVDWDYLYRNYQSAVDWPTAAYVDRLIERYPDAKVILTVRDPQKWFESASSTIFPGMEDGLRSDSPLRRERCIMSSNLIRQIFDGRYLERDHAISVFERHNQEMVKLLPPKQLLVYRISDQWGPLCGFLGIPVPDCPFPHQNDRVAFQKMIPTTAATLRRSQ